MTMIVTLTTAVSIFVAADSRATVQGPDGQLQVQAGVFQKVDIAGQNSIIAASGLFGIHTGLPALDWDSMVSLRNAATGLSGTFEAQFDDLSRRYKDSTSQAISRLPRRLEGLTPSSRPNMPGVSPGSLAFNRRTGDSALAIMSPSGKAGRISFWSATLTSNSRPMQSSRWLPGPAKTHHRSQVGNCARNLTNTPSITTR